MAREFYVVIEQDEDGKYIAEVPQLRACYTQASTLDQLMERVKEVIELCLEEEDSHSTDNDRKIIGIQKVAI